jgi:hypothetical protein
LTTDVNNALPNAFAEIVGFAPKSPRFGTREVRRNRIAPGMDTVGQRFDFEEVREYQREMLAIGLTAFWRFQNGLRDDAGHVRFEGKICPAK